MIGIILFGLFVAGFMLFAPVYIIWVILQLSIEGNRVFLGEIDSARGEFFEKAFQLSRRDLEFFHFDGKYFHLMSGTHHFSQFVRAQCLKSKNVIVRNRKLPHHSRWKHERLSGGPDHRYSNNHEILRSIQHTLVLEGSLTHRLVTYDSTSDDKSIEIRKLNRFLELSNWFDMECILIAYAESKSNLDQLERRRVSLVRRVARLHIASEAAHRLSPNNPEEISIENINDERERITLAVTRLDERIRAAKNDLSNGLRQVKKMLARFEDIATVKSALT